MNPNETPPTDKKPDEPSTNNRPLRQFNWLLFFSALLAPPILTLLTAALAPRSDVSVPIALFGSALGGLVCGLVLGRHLGRSTGARVGLSLLFVALFAVVCFVMSFVGCLAGGFNVNIH